MVIEYIHKLERNELKNELLIFLFIASAFSQLSGGKKLSKQSKDEVSDSKPKSISTEYEPYQKEMRAYLDQLPLDKITSKKALIMHLKTFVIQDMNDSSKFNLYLTVFQSYH
jgi:hypothetical protein